MKKLNTVAILCLSASLIYACGKEETPDDGGLGGGGGDAFVVEGSGGKAPSATGGVSSGTGGMGGTETIETTLAACVSTAAVPPGGVLLYDDFDDGDAEPSGTGPAGVWYEYGDDGGSQVPAWSEPDGWQPAPGGLTEDGFALHAIGSGYNVYGSGQGTVPAWDESANDECRYDLSAFDGVSFWIRGEVINEKNLVNGEDSEVLKFGLIAPDVIPVEEGGLCTGNNGGCWDWHKIRLSLTPCWKKHSFRFDELEQDGWGAHADALHLDQIVNFNFEISQGHRFDFWLDEVTLFAGDTPPDEDLCDDGMGGAGGAAGAGNQ